MNHQIERTIPVQIVGGEDLYNMVRAALIAQGTNLNQWCKAKGINRQTVDKALKGHRIGRRAQAIRDQFATELFSPSENAA